MNQVEFYYKGKNTIIQCNSNEKIGLIFQKFSNIEGVNMNSLLFLHSIQNNINNELTIDKIVNNTDKIRNQINIIVFDKNSLESSYISTSYSLNISSQNVFDTMKNINQSFIKLENEIKEESKNMRYKVELMKNKLKEVTKKKIRFHKATYFGETIGNEITGLGIISNDDGRRFEGEMSDSDRNGIGVFYGIKGDIFMGEYKDNIRNGFGIEENPNVGKYEGTWSNDSLTGIGILTYRDGCIYIGQMDRAQLSGLGKFIFFDGDYFIGYFKDSTRSKGKTFYSEENGIFDAIWEEDEKTKELIGKGIFYFSDGRKEKRTRIIGETEGVWKYN